MNAQELLEQHYLKMSEYIEQCIKTYNIVQEREIAVHERDKQYYDNEIFHNRNLADAMLQDLIAWEKEQYLRR